MYFFVFVAAAVALYFAVEASRRPRPGLIVAAIVWLLYAVYEYFVASGVLCDANCNIRVDLILIWPLVWIASLFGIYAPGQWTRAGKVLGGVSLFFLASMAALSLYIVLVENPAAERARAKSCDAQGQSGPEGQSGPKVQNEPEGQNEQECPPAAPSAGSTTGPK